MSTPLRALIVEDSENDCLLLTDTLAHGGYEVTCQRVETAAAMKAALAHERWDIVISDHRMPQFSSLAALKLCREHNENIPFIVVSGSIGEELAVSAMKAGAHDYIMKDNLARLVPAVGRELREAESRLRRTQQQVVERERLRALGQMVGGTARDFNNALSKILGFTELLLTSPDKLRNAGTVVEHLRMIRTTALGAAQIVRRFHESYRPSHDTGLLQLVVEDKPMIQGIKAEYPSSVGQGVETSVDDCEGSSKFRASKFDLVPVEQVMP
jgi:CheY-like chemotaxis protein